jgi:uncharacterized protein (DUF302 family)
MNLDYTKTSSKSADALMDAVQAAAAKRNFRTLHVHDVQATLAEKGFELMPYRIVEVCNAGFAHKAISAHTAIGMMLPCRIVVFEKDGVSTAMLLRPGIMGDIMPDADLGTLPEEVEAILKEVVDEAVA